MKNMILKALICLMCAPLWSAETPAPVALTPRKVFMPAQPPKMPEIPTITVGWLDIDSAIGNYEDIFQPLEKLVTNTAIDIIILQIDSPGGSPGDSAIIADYIRSARAVKPIIAFSPNLCASGAYWIASSCSYIICPAIAGIGSIAAATHYSFSKKENLYVIASGNLKLPSPNKDNELDPEFLEHTKKLTEEMGQLFVHDVSRNRAIPVETILSWQGQLFTGVKALSLGLVDQIGTLNELFEKTVQVVSEKNSRSYEQLKIIDDKNTVLKLYTI